MKLMKMGVICVLVVFFLTILGSQAAAHPPGFIIPKYEDGSVKLTVIHFSFNPKGSHYVYQIEIEKNGQSYLTENYENQTRFLFNTYIYEVEAETGDELTVTAFCSLFGQKSKTITV
jgi:hypothetical protein